MTSLQDNLPPSFVTFLIAVGHTDLVPGDFPRRLKAFAYAINSLDELQTWARLRWPEWYAGAGKERMALIWAAYLAWAELDA